MELVHNLCQNSTKVLLKIFMCMLETPKAKSTLLVYNLGLSNNDLDIVMDNQQKDSFNLSPLALALIFINKNLVQVHNLLKNPSR